MKRVRSVIRRIPVLGRVVTITENLLERRRFPGSTVYWERRYGAGDPSGAGSQGRLAQFKAEVVNVFVRDHDVHSVAELGCGDGQQLALAHYPNYLGLDISPTVVKRCVSRFAHDPTKRFVVYDPETFQVGEIGQSDLALSLDVIYHLVEDAVYDLYMQHLFSLANRFVIVYSSNTDKNVIGRRAHIKHRQFTRWIENHGAEWKLLQRIPNQYPLRNDIQAESWAEFYIYQRATALPLDGQSK